MKNTKTLSIGNELKRKDYDLKNPSRYVVTQKEFDEMKKENVDEVQGFDFEEYCEIEREGWCDMARNILREPYEALDIIPKSQPWGSRVKRITHEKLELEKQLPVMFEEEIIEEVD